MIYEREVMGSLIRYDSDTGEIWRVLLVSCQYGRAGEWRLAGLTTHFGYKKVFIDGRNLRVHRVIWFIVHGKWPTKLLDHIDGDRSNNRLINLREANHSQNAMNSKRGKGWCFHKRHGKWQARIRAMGKRLYLGSFETEAEAREAYVAAAMQYHGEYSARIAA